MFDFDAGKLLIVGVIALIFIPPKDLPRALRTAGQFVGRMRRMASDFQSQFMDAMREADMADVRAEARKLAESARLEHGLDDVGSVMTAQPRVTDERTGQGEAKPAEPEAAKSEVTKFEVTKSEATKSEPPKAATEKAQHPA